MSLGLFIAELYTDGTHCVKDDIINVFVMDLLRFGLNLRDQSNSLMAINYNL